jgi:predicted nucleotidyltransferase component of viral defense system
MFFQVLSDHLNSLLTDKLQAVAEVCRQFYLAGGTALALHLGHRKSEDLDFFSEHEFDNEQVIQAILKLGGRVDSESRGTIHTFITGSKVSFLYYPYPLIRNTVTIDNINVASIEDIACMKVIATAQRAEKKDFFDMHEILRIHSPSAMRDMVIQKYGERRINCYHVVKSFFYFDEAERSLDPISLNNTNWQQVKDYFIRNEKELTSGLCHEL